MKQPRKISYRQLKLLESEMRVDERIRAEVIDTIADLLLEALGAMAGESAEAKSESKD